MLTLSPALAELLTWMRQVAPQAQLHSDSRTITPGDIFFAYPGDTSDGRQYLAQAINNGASAVIFESNAFGWPPSLDIAHKGINDLKKSAGILANAYYGNPDKGMFVTAITGTNGKTSSAQWLASTLSRLETSSAAIGTLGLTLFKNGRANESKETGFTTPDALLLQGTLLQLQQQNIQAIAIEASSIGIDQGRLNGLHIDTALFTNCTRDHLDYHQTIANYQAAKEQLFYWPNLKHAVINIDDAFGLTLISALKNKPLSSLIAYTINAPAIDGIPTLCASNIRASNMGTTFHVESPFGSGQIKTRLLGQFNVSNILGVLGVLLTKGYAWQAVVHAIEALEAVPGRMQQLGGNDAPLVIVDYAHSPDALEKTLNALREIAQERHGKLWCLFGCGGDRDAGKRAQMGAVASMADQIIITNDNPRSENPTDIIKQIMTGIDLNATTPHINEDRASAILWSIKHADKNDVVLLAGKGHETYQEIMRKKLHFSDAEHAALALADRLTLRGGF